MSFSEKLYQNFIEDDRWLLLVNGLKVTILVTLFALLVGVIIGFTVAIIRSLHDKTGKFKILNAICKVYLTIIRGTPSMIQVLFMYLVVFGASSLNSIVIGGLAFGINSGAYVAEIVPVRYYGDSGRTDRGWKKSWVQLWTDDASDHYAAGI